MRFLHVADVHLDTLFASRTDELRARLRAASREAFRRAVTAAIERRADALLIAGDLFDGERLSFQTERFLLDELGRLVAGGVRVVYAAGNHDPGRGSSRAGGLAWPEGVVVVREEEPIRVTITDAEGKPIGVVTAAGHETADVRNDLSRRFPSPEGQLPEVALLHTQVVSAHGSGEHGRYAPSELPHLEASGYDYWALGHVHLRQALSDSPAIRYPGNPQGRNPRESGAKGALLVDLTDRGAPGIEFVDLAPVRWETLRVSGLEDTGRLDLLVRSIAEAWEGARAADPGAPGVEWLARVELRGPCPLWRELAGELPGEDDRRTLEDELVTRLGLLGAEVRAERLHAVHAAGDHAERQDVLGESLRLLRRARDAAPSDLLGVDEAALAGYEPTRDGPLDAYLAALLEEQEGELLARLLAPGGEPTR